MVHEWENIKKEYETTNASLRQIAQTYGINHSTISKKAKNELWNAEHRIKKKAPQNVEKPHNKILGKIAKRKIEEVKKELGENYSSVDEPLIVMYAKNYERYIDLEQELMEKGILSYSSKTGAEYMSPTFTAQLAIQKNLVTIANQLGLSIASRKKLGLKFEVPGQKQTIFDFGLDINADEDLNDI